MSTQDGFVPPAYMKVCKRMQDRVPVIFKSSDEVRRFVERELGRPIESVFSFFDDEPIGVASIAQVHRARLLDGTDVVVKLQVVGLCVYVCVCEALVFDSIL